MATQMPAAGETRTHSTANHTHLTASGENWWKRGWRGLLEWGKGGSLSQPPFPREQIQHPHNLSCCAGCSGATGTLVSACGAGELPQVPWALLGRSGKHLWKNSFARQNKCIFFYTKSSPLFVLPHMYVHTPPIAIVQSPVASTKDAKIYKDEVTRSFYAEMGQGSQVCRQASCHPSD